MPDENGEPTIWDRGALVSLRVSTWGAKRQLDDDEYRVVAGADQDLTRAVKCLIDPKNLQPMVAARSQAWAVIKQRTIAFPIRGLWFVPRDLIPEIDGTLKALEADFSRSADVFSDNYESTLAEAKTRLGPLYDEKQYPSKADIRSKFAIDWSFFTIQNGGPNVLSPDLYAREAGKVKDMMAQFREEASAALRVRFAELVKHLTDRISGLDDGTAKRFHASSVDALRGFLKDFSALNINDDRDLEALVEQAGKVIEGVVPEQIRESPGVRQTVNESLGKVQEALDGLMVERPMRIAVRKNAPKPAEPAPAVPATEQATITQ